MIPTILMESGVFPPDDTGEKVAKCYIVFNEKSACYIYWIVDASLDELMKLAPVHVQDEIGVPLFKALLRSLDFKMTPFSQ